MKGITIIISVKGNKRSGFHGHAGRRGKRGGSISFKYLKSSVDEIKEYEAGKGYFITPDDKLIDTGLDMAGGSSYDHVGTMVMSEHPELFGLSEQEQNELKTLYAEFGKKKSNWDMLDMWAEKVSVAFEKVARIGFIRVRDFRDSVSIDTGPFDNSVLRRLQHLVMSNKLRLSSTVYIDTGIGKSYNNVPKDDLMSAESIMDLMQYRTH